MDKLEKPFECGCFGDTISFIDRRAYDKAIVVLKYLAKRSDMPNYEREDHARRVLEDLGEGKVT